ncbi:MAG TPA: hypothetical protein VKM55_07655 [Candidatus Lokiarchaeia archaeon]|nr:hypothetical protein [Candidatus Lokiarchaeia archaeon]
MPINKEWHASNKLPRNAKLDDRIKWHLEHEKNCGCRSIPENLKEEIKKRGLH